MGGALYVVGSHGRGRGELTLMGGALPFMVYIKCISVEFYMCQMFKNTFY